MIKKIRFEKNRSFCAPTLGRGTADNAGLNLTQRVSLIESRSRNYHTSQQRGKHVLKVEKLTSVVREFMHCQQHGRAGLLAVSNQTTRVQFLTTYGCIKTRKSASSLPSHPHLQVNLKFVLFANPLHIKCFRTYTDPSSKKQISLTSPQLSPCVPGPSAHPRPPESRQRRWSRDVSSRTRTRSFCVNGRGSRSRRKALKETYDVKEDHEVLFSVHIYSIVSSQNKKKHQIE